MARVGICQKDREREETRGGEGMYGRSRNSRLRRPFVLLLEPQRREVVWLPPKWLQEHSMTEPFVGLPSCPAFTADSGTVL